MEEVKRDRIFGTIFVCTGFVIVIYFGSWMLALGIFLLTWGNNIGGIIARGEVKR